MIILFKYYTDVENCKSFRRFGFIYIYWYHARAMHGLIKELYINFKKYIFR